MILFGYEFVYIQFMCCAWYNVCINVYIIDANPYSYEEVAKKKGKESTSSRRMMSRMQYQDPKESP